MSTPAKGPPLQGEPADDLDEATSRALVKIQSGSSEMDASLAVSLTKAEIDTQIQTAKSYPRSMAQAIRNVIELATTDTATATECIYSLPRDGKAITGPSVRLAELLFQQWGNNRVATRITAVDKREGFVEAEAMYHDLETNSALGAKVRRSIRGKSRDGKPGRIFSDDMITVTGNAAAAIAKRNAIFAGIPRPIWRQAYEKAMAVVRGDEKTLGARRVDMLRTFNDQGLAPAVVFQLVGVKGEADIGLDEMVVLAGMWSALKNGEATIDDLRGRVAAPTGQARTLDSAFGKPAAGTPAHDPVTGEVADEPAKDESAAAEPEQSGDTNVVDLTKAAKAKPAAAKAKEPEPEPEPEVEEQGETEAKEPEPNGPTWPDEEETQAAEGELDTAAFNAFAARVANAGFVETAYSHFAKFEESAAYLAADADLQWRTRALVAHKAAQLVEAGAPDTPETNAKAYRLWLAIAEPVEVRTTFAKLIRTKSWGAESDEFKTKVSGEIAEVEAR